MYIYIYAPKYLYVSINYIDIYEDIFTSENTFIIDGALIPLPTLRAHPIECPLFQHYTMYIYILYNT